MGTGTDFMTLGGYGNDERDLPIFGFVLGS